MNILNLSIFVLMANNQNPTEALVVISKFQGGPKYSPSSAAAVFGVYELIRGLKTLNGNNILSWVAIQ